MSIDPKRGEIWQVDLEPTRGAEMRKIRPVVVISSNRMGRLPLRLIVPLTGWDENYAQLSWMVRIGAGGGTGLTKSSAADVFQMRGLSLERFGSKRGVLSKAALDRIAAAIALTVEFNQ